MSALREILRPGETCPLCGRGKVYDTERPAPIVRITGQPPLAARRWLCQTLRCPTCGHLVTARAPKEAQGAKYDETAVSMIVLLHYGTGLPYYRLAGVQGNLKTPVPPSTLWDVVNEAVAAFRPVFDQMCRQAAQSKLLHNDDSRVRVLEFMGKRRAKLLAEGALPDHGALAPRANLRPALVAIRPRMTTSQRPPPPSASRQRIPWADLLRRVFAIDVLRGARCGARRVVLAVLTEPAVLEKILRHLGLPSRPPSRPPPRPPPSLDDADAPSPPDAVRAARKGYRVARRALAAGILGDDLDPAPSPDGSRIAVASTREGPARIFVRSRTARS